MKISIFNPKAFDARTQPMFLGESVNVSRFDRQKYPRFAKLNDTQIGFFWRPEEVDLTKDMRDFAELPHHAQRIFIRNLQYQTLLDSVQGRSPTQVFSPITSIPELENLFNSWGFFEGNIHSRSYTHIKRNVYSGDPSKALDEIMEIQEILERAQSVTAALDQCFLMCVQRPDLYTEKQQRQAVLQAIMATNILEGVRFYVSFACSFAFAEAGVMEGNAKIIKLIARDEAVHLAASQYMLNLFRTGQEGPEWQEDYEELVPSFQAMYTEAWAQERAWVDYLFQDGPILGLNAEILYQYIDFLTAARMDAIKLPHDFPENLRNPISWVNHWYSSSGIQEAPQETEKESYVVGGVSVEVTDGDMESLRQFEFD